MEQIRTYKPYEIEYMKLQFFVDCFNYISGKYDTPYMLKIENIYFDMGQDWWYSALITYDVVKGDSWQSVCPRDYKLIIDSDSFSDVKRYAEYYFDELYHNENICVNISKVQ